MSPELAVIAAVAVAVVAVLASTRLRRPAPAPRVRSKNSLWSLPALRVMPVVVLVAVALASLQLLWSGPSIVRALMAGIALAATWSVGRWAARGLG